jgi:dynein assembly factor 3
MSGGVEGFGSTTCWGFSPALDLAAVAPTPECSNILVVGSGDLRHVLMTLANSTKPLHFYVAESSLELLARHMLFLTLASEPLDQLGLQERSELFLELYGNTLVRHQTSQWLSEKANQLIRSGVSPVIHSSKHIVTKRVEWSQTWTSRRRHFPCWT